MKNDDGSAPHSQLIEHTSSVELELGNLEVRRNVRSLLHIMLVPSDNLRRLTEPVVVRSRHMQPRLLALAPEMFFVQIHILQFALGAATLLAWRTSLHQLLVLLLDSQELMGHQNGRQRLLVCADHLVMLAEGLAR